MKLRAQGLLSTYTAAKTSGAKSWSAYVWELQKTLWTYLKTAKRHGEQSYK